MKLLGLGDNVMDAYLFRGELYPYWPAGSVLNIQATWECWQMIHQVVISWPPSGRNPWKSAVSVLVWANPHVTILCWMTMETARSQEIMAKRPCKIFSLYT